MPADNSLGLHQEPGHPPSSGGARAFAFQHSGLPSQGQAFQGGITPTRQKNQEWRDNGEDGWDLRHRASFRRFRTCKVRPGQLTASDRLLWAGLAQL